jgi:hypothetical protein
MFRPLITKMLRRKYLVERRWRHALTVLSKRPKEEGNYADSAFGYWTNELKRNRDETERGGRDRARGRNENFISSNPEP